MARRGDGLYLRGNTWYLDCRLNGARYVVRLGKGITRRVASEIATVKGASGFPREVRMLKVLQIGHTFG